MPDIFGSSSFPVNLKWLFIHNSEISVNIISQSDSWYTLTQSEKEK